MHDSTKITSRYNDGDYLAKNEDWHVADSPWKADQIDRIIKRNGITLSSICEIGCGAGEVLRQLSLKTAYEKVEFYGYEISDDAFALCTTREADRLHYYKKNLLDLEEKYDALLCIDVFEHVEDYIGFLKLLKSKGNYKVFHIPLDLSVLSLIRGRPLYFRESVGHLHYFTPDTAIATLSDCGYEIIDVMHTPWFAEQPSKTVKAKLAKTLRSVLYKASPKLMSTWLGGSSLMVLAK
ncbi:class I SAM-dependent methyltransferase [Rhodospira trueperi]|uniref:Methyltransferase domain-containing protein n=1 Tax=Rhodospira trueperi TaxID=69960 RepID=A0A1G6W508_9PROT|nr:class I SAM-dependent methyltransferase [Rhodospira trueperi]SDD60878.1 Methyltransferase domain-containing protein [Rhodospira trueperi]